MCKIVLTKIITIIINNIVLYIFKKKIKKNKTTMWTKPKNKKKNQLKNHSRYGSINSPVVVSHRKKKLFKLFFIFIYLNILNKRVEI